MKKLLLIIILLVLPLISFAQFKPHTQIFYEKDVFEDKEYLSVKNTLDLSDKENKGISIFPYFEKISGVWTCVALGVNNFPDSENICYGDDELLIVFEDGTKVNINSWRSFSCHMNYNFDYKLDLRKQLSKPIEGIRFFEGGGRYSFKKLITDSDEKNYFINAFKTLDDLNKNGLAY